MKNPSNLPQAAVRVFVSLIVLVPGLCLVAGAQATEPLPPELSGLTPLFGDEQKLVGAIRQFDLHQTGLAIWDHELAQMYAKQGEQALAEERMKKAAERVALVRRAYEEGLNRFPSNTSLKTYYGETIQDFPVTADDESRAVQLWEEVVAADPKFSDAWNNLAIFYSHSGEYKKCFEAIDKALAVEPDNPDYLFNAAQFLLIHTPQAQENYGWSAEQTYKKAMEHSRKAAELRPDNYPLLQDYAANFYRGEQLKLPVDWKEAATAWQKARAYARNADEKFFAWLNEGRAWLRAQDKAKARAALEEALRMYPQSEPAQRLLEQAKS